jgi:hypothetical protein
MGKRKTSVCDKNGNDRYPRCVIYQYHAKLEACNELLTIIAKRDLPKTKGRRKN